MQEEIQTPVPILVRRIKVPEAQEIQKISFEEFMRVDIRVGEIIDAQEFPEARRPAYKLWIDFGKRIGVKKSSAQITIHYSPESLIGRQVGAVVNFPPRQIGPLMSEVLTLGFPDENGLVPVAPPVCARVVQAKMPTLGSARELSLAVRRLCEPNPPPLLGGQARLMQRSEPP